mmetsp:Transcript_266/g.599  ORF Transcript_266/g.599 Transcript_266/m.599 type:complete len:317 (+) Transcript_266:137-1087(+)
MSLEAIREALAQRVKRNSFLRVESGNPAGHPPADPSAGGGHGCLAGDTALVMRTVSSAETMPHSPRGSQGSESSKEGASSKRRPSATAAPTGKSQAPIDGATLLDSCGGSHTVAYVSGGMLMAEFAAVMIEDASRQDHLTELIGDMLEETVSRNDARGRKGVLASFEGAKKAPISPADYVRRIMKYAGCSPCCLAVGVFYLERLKRRHSGLCLTSYNFQRLFLVAIMEAAKYLDDIYYSNKHWAEIGGFELEEMNSLELEFLFRINFYLSVQREDYDSFVSQLVWSDQDTPPPQPALPAAPKAPSKDSKSPDATAS